MAKKGKRRKGTKRKTKPAKRRTSKRNIKMKLERGEYRLNAPADGFDPTPYDIAASRRKLSAPLESTIGGTETPLPLRTAGHTIEPPTASVEVSTTPPEVRAPIQVAPTVYPESPHGTIIVQNHNHITINIPTDEFRHFNTNFDLLIRELRYSNEISGELRDQLLSELKAGREIITGPKPQRALVDLLLLRPLKWLAEKSGSAVVSKLAADVLTWLLKIIV
jgi:hypothetical protein